jgi:putative redox protein
MAVPKRSVVVAESADKPYGQSVTIGRHSLSADEAEALGGHDTGPSPYEYVMAGLGACTAMTLRMYADRHGWPLEKISVEVRHKVVVGSDGKAATDRFERIIGVEGTLTGEQRAELLKIADHCPVSRTLQRASKIVSTLAEAPAPTSSRL